MSIAETQAIHPPSPALGSFFSPPSPSTPSPECLLPVPGAGSGLGFSPSPQQPVQQRRPGLAWGRGGRDTSSLTGLLEA